MHRKDQYRGRPWMAAGALALTVIFTSVFWQAAGGQEPASAGDSGAAAQARSLSRAFRAAAKKVLPTVVSVKTTVKSRRVEMPEGNRQRENPFQGTPWEDFFDEPGMPDFFRYHPGIPQREGLGSGVIIDPAGIILTNNHVVEGADEIAVELSDGRQFKAVDVKSDEQTDLAVVRISADEPLPAAAMGDSDSLEIGDWVLAVGNPFELEGTVSAGIISSKGRALRTGKRANFLQTDAMINPGNSGGPLVNLDGQVVGINTAIASSNGGYQGVGFAIPVNLAKWVTGQLVQSGKVERAYLGVKIAEMDAQLAGKFGVPPNKGVLVMDVYPDTPAAAAGFAEGDVILAFAGQPVNDPRGLQQVVERSAAGSKQTVDILRNRKPTKLTVVVKPLPGDFGVASVTPRARPRGGSVGPTFTSEDLGLEVGELTAQVAQQLDLEGFSGVLITGVDPDGIAASAGLSAGMLIRSVEQKPVASVAEFEAALKGKSLRDGILLNVRTPDGNVFLVLQSS
ncbi:MAG: Do family serine endopeptidase [Pirellulales bacterium]|nr:Do family serine endopeptidase [Pirellulales bacterium]